MLSECQFDSRLTPAWRVALRALGFALPLVLPICGAGDIQTTSQTLLLDVSPEGKISVPANVDLRWPIPRSAPCRVTSRSATGHVRPAAVAAPLRCSLQISRQPAARPPAK